MRFVTIRDLRGRPREVWRKLAEDRDLIVTSNGRPLAILTSVSEEDLEDSLAALRQARAVAAVARMQRRSVELGLDKLTLEDVNAEIAAVRRQRRK